MQTTFPDLHFQNGAALPPRPRPSLPTVVLAPPPFFPPFIPPLNKLYVADFLPQTSGRGTGTPSQRDQDVQKENLRLESENLELRFQLEQNVKDLPRLRVRGTFTHFTSDSVCSLPAGRFMSSFSFPCLTEPSVRPEGDERRSEEGSGGAGEETGPDSWSSCLCFLSLTFSSHCLNPTRPFKSS